MGQIKNLAGQTAVYGVSTVVGRLLNFLLVPLYTYTFEPSAYGVVTELYAYITFLLILYTYGMETTFFRFISRAGNKILIASTSFTCILITAVLFSGLILIFNQPIANSIYYQDNPEYIRWIGLILIFDTLAVIPFALLRYHNQAMRFAGIKLANISLNISFNLFFIVFCPWILKFNLPAGFEAFINLVYKAEIGVGYVFISNLLASLLTLPLLYKSFATLRLRLDIELLKKMIPYTIPLLIVGMAGMVNEVIDRILLKYLLPYSMDVRMEHIGIYGACYKLAIFMTLAVQSFRYAAEPFFFSRSLESDAKSLYAKVMTYFIICGWVIFLAVMLFLDLFKYIISPAYHEGLHIVPILLIANLVLGVYYNLSVWYKLTDKTYFGAMIAIIGAIITIILNILLIPVLGYTGSAWATLACYSSMVLISYLLGKKYYAVPYQLYKPFVYSITALAIYFIHHFIILAQFSLNTFYSLLSGLLFFSLYLALILILEKPKIALILQKVKVLLSEKFGKS